MDKEKPVLVKMKIKDATFEAVCHPRTVREYREGKLKDVHQVLVDSDNVYKNFGKGERWALKDLESHFETRNVEEILTRIVKNGHAQVTSEEVSDDIKAKKHEIMGYYSKHFVDPKTGNGIPISRIESAFDQLKAVTIDPKRSASDQANELLRRVQDTGLAMKKKEMIMTLSVPNAMLAAVQGALKKSCTIYATTFPEGGGDKSARLEIGFAPSDLDSLQNEIGKLTKGAAVFDSIDAAGGTAKEEGKGGKKKKGG